MNNAKIILSTTTKRKALFITEMSEYDTQIKFLSR